MMLRRVLVLGALLAVAPVAALGCGDDEESGSAGSAAAVPNEQKSVDPTFGHRLKCTESPTMAELLNYQVPKAKERYKLTLMEVSLAGYYYQGIKVGAEQAAKEAGVELTTVAAKGYVSPEQQLRQLETAIQRQTDGIVFAPSDYKGSIPVVQQAKAAGIPVVNISTEIATTDGVKKVLQDDYLLGRLAADDVAKAVGPEGGPGIIIAGPANADWSRKRAAGFKDQVREKYPNIKVVASPTQLVDPQAGLKSFEDALQANPDIKWIYSVHYFILPPKSVPERYRGKIPYVSAGLEPDSIAALKDGSLRSVLAIQPILMGRMGVGELIKEIEGQPVPDVTCVPAPRFTKANVDSPEAEIQLIPGSVKE